MPVAAIGDATIGYDVMGEGDTTVVLTPGGRVHVRCLVIRPSLAIVEANGQRRDLHF